MITLTQKETHSDSEESDSDEDGDEDEQPELEAALIKHNGCVNRIRVRIFYFINDKPYINERRNPNTGEIAFDRIFGLVLIPFQN